MGGNTVIAKIGIKKKKPPCGGKMLCHVARFVVVVVGFSAVNGFSSSYIVTREGFWN